MPWLAVSCMFWFRSDWCILWRKFGLKRKSGRESELDLPFTIGELRKALAKTAKSATGKDEISYIMIKHISEGGLYKLLPFFNKVWREGRIPMSWKEAIIIPIRKPGKDPSKPTNYRPIALTSHICKWMERMVNGRLMYVLERKNLVAAYCACVIQNAFSELGCWYRVQPVEERERERERERGVELKWIALL